MKTTTILFIFGVILLGLAPIFAVAFDILFNNVSLMGELLSAKKHTPSLIANAFGIFCFLIGLSIVWFTRSKYTYKAEGKQE